MNMSDYQQKAMRTSPPDHDRIKNGCLGLIGESGELVDLVKKFMFQSGKNPPVPVDAIVKELGDILWYYAELAEGMGLSMNNMLPVESCKFDWDVKNAEHMAIYLSKNAMDIYAAAPNKRKDLIVPFCITNGLIRVAWFASMIGKSLSDIADANIAKLEARYPNGFEPERSLKRGTEA